MPRHDRLPDDYDVPCFHAFASENEAMKWDFFVRHYGDDAAQKLDPKYREVWDGERVDGVLYPRAGTLGGCTAHNAMIFVYPNDADWDGIAALTGDPSWNCRQDARLLRAAGELPSSLACIVGWQSSASILRAMDGKAGCKRRRRFR